MPRQAKDPLAEFRKFVRRFSTQREAARALGISEPYVTDLIKGRRTFSRTVLAKLGLQQIVVEK